ncbi:MAG: 16S rRNA (guanine(527)-N(7))-methyltransferase RsmG [Methylophilaceae bacterium]
MSQLADKLSAGVAAMGLPVSSATQKVLLTYLVLLGKWNKVYNLTAVRDPVEMVTLHLLDSLSVLPFIKSKNLLDVGSGGGLPGIVLAICLPELQVTTIDAVQKKVIFMRQVKGELGLNNLNVIHERVERFESKESFEVIISRAFSEINVFMALTQHLLAKDGVWLAMKGVSPSEELQGLGVKNSQVYPLPVAGLEAERHLAVIEKF